MEEKFMLINKGAAYIWLRVVSFAMLIIFSSTTVLQAAAPLQVSGPRAEVNLPSLIDEILVPPDFGMIRESFKPLHQKLPAAFPVPFVIHIEEAHGQPEGQANIEKLLSYFRRTHGLKTVFLEGAWRKLDPEALHFFDDADLNMKFLAELNRMGLAGGVELDLAAAASAKQGSARETLPVVWGAEDLALYKKNLEQFREVYANKAEADLFLKKLRTKISGEVARIFNPELRAFFKEWAFWEEIADQRFAGLERLMKDAVSYLKVDLSDPAEQYDWPQLVRFFRLKALEKEGDRTDGSEQFEEKKLKTWLEEKQLTDFFRDFDSVLRPASSSRVSDVRTQLETFYAVAVPRGFRFEEYPCLTRLTGISILSSEIQAEDLLRETAKLRGMILDKLASSREEQNTVKRYREYLLLKKLFALEMTREEYQQLDGGWHSAGNSEVKTPFSALHSSPGLQAAFSAALSFYKTATAREQIIFDKTLRKMRLLKESNAILVTGGFHSGGIAELFRRNGVSYIRVSPRITKPENPGPYLDLMLGFKNERTCKPLSESKEAPKKPFRNTAMPSSIRISSVGAGFAHLRNDLGAATADHLFEKFREALQKISSRDVPDHELIARLRSPAVAAHGFSWGGGELPADARKAGLGAEDFRDEKEKITGRYEIRSVASQKSPGESGADRDQAEPSAVPGGTKTIYESREAVSVRAEARGFDNASNDKFSFPRHFRERFVRGRLVLFFKTPGKWLKKIARLFKIPRDYFTLRNQLGVLGKTSKTPILPKHRTRLLQKVLSGELRLSGRHLEVIEVMSNGEEHILGSLDAGVADLVFLEDGTFISGSVKRERKEGKQVLLRNAKAVLFIPDTEEFVLMRSPHENEGKQKMKFFGGMVEPGTYSRAQNPYDSTILREISEETGMAHIWGEGYQPEGNLVLAGERGMFDDGRKWEPRRTSFYVYIPTPREISAIREFKVFLDDARGKNYSEFIKRLKKWKKSIKGQGEVSEILFLTKKQLTDASLTESFNISSSMEKLMANPFVRDFLNNFRIASSHGPEEAVRSVQSEPEPSPLPQTIKTENHALDKPFLWWTQHFSGERETSLDARHQEAYGAFWQNFFEGVPVGSKVLDLGAGNLFVARQALQTKKNFELWALDGADIGKDYIPESVHFVRSRGEDLDLTELPKDLDAVVSQYALEYMNEAEVLLKLTRVMKKGARALFIMHRADSGIIEKAKIDLEQFERIRESGLLEAVNAFLESPDVPNGFSGILRSLRTLKILAAERQAEIWFFGEKDPLSAAFLSRVLEIFKTIISASGDTPDPGKTAEILKIFEENFRRGEWLLKERIRAAKDLQQMDFFIHEAEKHGFRLTEPFERQAVFDSGVSGWQVGFVFEPEGKNYPRRSELRQIISPRISRLPKILYRTALTGFSAVMFLEICGAIRYQTNPSVKVLGHLITEMITGERPPDDYPENPVYDITAGIPFPQGIRGYLRENMLQVYDNEPFASGGLQSGQCVFLLAFENGKVGAAHISPWNSDRNYISNPELQEYLASIKRIFLEKGITEKAAVHLFAAGESAREGFLKTIRESFSGPVLIHNDHDHMIGIAVSVGKPDNETGARRIRVKSNHFLDEEIYKTFWVNPDGAVIKRSELREVPQSAQTRGLKKYQEDRFINQEIRVAVPGFLSSGRLMAVMDGHNGSRVSRLLQLLLAPVFRFMVLLRGGDIRAAFSGTFRTLHLLTVWFDSGSTLSAVFVPDNKKDLFVMIVGDSPVYVLKDNREFLSFPQHTVGDDPALLSAPGFKIVKSSNVPRLMNLRTRHFFSLTRAFGDRSFRKVLVSKPFITRLDLRGAKSSVEILVATDGIHGYHVGDLKTIQDERIRYLASGSARAQDYIEFAGGEYAPDNTTLLRWVFAPSPESPAKRSEIRKDGSDVPRPPAGALSELAIPDESVIASDPVFGTIVDLGRIRLAAEAKSDIAGEIAALERAAFEDREAFGNKEDWDRAIGGVSTTLLLLGEKNNLRGFAHLRPATVFSLNNLKRIVSKKDGDKGKGVFLMDAVLSLLYRKGEKDLVWTSYWERSDRFYENYLLRGEKLGFLTDKGSLGSNFSITITGDPLKMNGKLARSETRETGSEKQMRAELAESERQVAVNAARGVIRHSRVLEMGRERMIALLVGSGSAANKSDAATRGLEIIFQDVKARDAGDKLSVILEMIDPSHPAVRQAVDLAVSHDLFIQIVVPGASREKLLEFQNGLIREAAQNRRSRGRPAGRSRIIVEARQNASWELLLKNPGRTCVFDARENVDTLDEFAARLDAVAPEKLKESYLIHDDLPREHSQKGVTLLFAVRDWIGGPRVFGKVRTTSRLLSNYLTEIHAAYSALSSAA